MSELDWNVEKQIMYLPEEIAGVFSREAERLYSDLRENRLKVVLVPARVERYEGHMIRAVESKNPEWYRELYRATPHLKRRRTLNSLERIARTQDLPYCDRRGAVSPHGSYDTRYRELIRERLTGGYDINGLFIPEHPRVTRFFLGSKGEESEEEEKYHFDKQIF